MTQNNEMYRGQYINNKANYLYLKEMEGAGIISSIKSKLMRKSSKENVNDQAEQELDTDRIAIFIRKCDVSWNTVINSVKNKYNKYEYNTQCDTLSKNYEKCKSDNNAYAKKNLIYTKIKENFKEKSFIIPHNKINEIISRSYYTESWIIKAPNINQTIEIGSEMKGGPFILSDKIVWGDVESYKNALRLINNRGKYYKIPCPPNDSCGEDTCKERLFDTVIVLRRFSGIDINKFKIEEIIDIA